MEIMEQQQHQEIDKSNQGDWPGRLQHYEAIKSQEPVPMNGTIPTL